MLSEGSNRFHPAPYALADGADAFGSVPGPWRCIIDFRYRKPRSAENMMSGEFIYGTRKPEFSSVVVFVTQHELYNNSRAHCQGKIGLFSWKTSSFAGWKAPIGCPLPGRWVPATLFFQFRFNRDIKFNCGEAAVGEVGDVKEVRGVKKK